MFKYPWPETCLLGTHQFAVSRYLILKMPPDFLRRSRRGLSGWPAPPWRALHACGEGRGAGSRPRQLALPGSGYWTSRNGRLNGCSAAVMAQGVD